MNRFLTAAAKTGAPALRIRHAVPSSSSSSAPSASASAAATMRCAVASRRLFSDSSASPSSGAGPGDSEIKFGTVKNFGLKGGFGFIIPDGVHKTGHAAKDLVFIHRADIMLKESKDGEAKYYPSLRRGQRVQFKVGPPAEGGLTGKAYDLTYEGGELVPPFQKDYLENFIKNQKAKFGDEVFDIFSTSKDQKELEMRIVAAFDRVKENIERQKAKVVAAGGESKDEE